MNIGPLDLGEDAVQTPERRIAEAWEVVVFQVQEMTGQGREICGVDEEATDDQDGRRTAASSAASRRGRDPVSIIPDHSGVSR